MRLVIVYREASEHRMAVESFMRDFKFQTGGEIEAINPDTREGAAFCQTYDVVEYPTMLAITSDGTPTTTWRGTLPTISDASGYN
ncbi:MAG: hypothetical protein ACM3JF_01130 [Sphaerimonospora mesophila]